MMLVELVRAVLIVALIVAPVAFFWHLEVLLTALEISGGDLPTMTNSFGTYSGNRVYHIGMYLLFITCWAAALFLMLV